MNISPEIFYGLGALALGAVMAFAYFRDKTRNKALDPITEAATRAEYQRPETREDRRD